MGVAATLLGAAAAHAQGVGRPVASGAAGDAAEAAAGWLTLGNLGWAGLLLLAIAAGLLLAAALRQPHYSIQRSLPVRAAPPTLFAVLQDLQQGPAWSTWGPFASQVTRRFSRTSAGLGAGCYWQDKPQGREGSMEVMHLEAPRQLAIAVTATLPVELHELAEFVLTPQADGCTLVRWTLRGEAPYAARLRAVLGSQERRLGRQMLADLQRLQALAERMPAPASADPASPPTGPA